MKKIILEAADLLRLAGDRDLYKAFPPGSDYLQAVARQAYSAALNDALHGKCSGCSDLATILQPFRDTLGKTLTFMAGAGQTDELATIADYIAGKLRYPKAPVVLYYRADDGPRIVTF